MEKQALRSSICFYYKYGWMEIMRVGCDKEKYLKIQSAHIMERI